MRSQAIVYSSNKIIFISALFSFIIFLTFTGQDIVIPVFPLYVKSFNGGAFQLGLLIGTFSFTSLVFAPVIGSLADRYGRKLFIILGLLGFALANILYTTAQSFDELLLFRIIEGATTAGTGAIIDAMLIDIIPESKRGKYLGYVNGFGYLGVILGPFLGGVLVSNGNFNLPFYVSALFALIGLGISLFLLPNDYQKFKTGEKITKSDSTSNLWFIKGGLVIFSILIVVRFAGIISWSLIEPVVPLYLYALNYNPQEVGFYFSTYGITMFLGQIFFGGLSDKFGRKKILQMGLGIYLIGFIVMMNANQILIFYFSNALNGLGFSLILPSVVSLLADLINDESNRGKIMSIYYDTLNLAGILGPLAGGYIGASRGFEIVLIISISIIFIGFVLTFLIRKTEQKASTVIPS